MRLTTLAELGTHQISDMVMRRSLLPKSKPADDVFVLLGGGTAALHRWWEQADLGGSSEQDWDLDRVWTAVRFAFPQEDEQPLQPNPGARLLSVFITHVDASTMSYFSIAAEDIQAGTELVDPPAPAEGAVHVKQMIDNGDIETARELLKAHLEWWPEDPALKQLAIALTRPTARVVSSEGRRQWREERQWIRRHGQEYPGQWLAVSGASLVDNDVDIEVLRTRLSADRGSANVLLHYQPGEQR